MPPELPVVFFDSVGWTVCPFVGFIPLGEGSDDPGASASGQFGSVGFFRRSSAGALAERQVADETGNSVSGFVGARGSAPRTAVLNARSGAGVEGAMPDCVGIDTPAEGAGGGGAGNAGCHERGGKP